MGVVIRLQGAIPRLTQMTTCPIPINKADLATAEALLTYHQPLTEAEYRQVIVWLKDENWPVFPAIATFLAQRGAEVEPAILLVLRSKNEAWKRNVVQHVLAHWPRESLVGLERSLSALVTHADVYGPDTAAARVLLQHGLGDRDWLRQWLEHKHRTLSAKVRELEALLETLAND